MAKFKVQVELQGFKMFIEGEREDIPLIRDAVTDQMRGLLTPAATIVEGEKPEENGAKEVTPLPALPPPPAKKKRVTKAKAAAADEEGAVIEFNYDATVWGQPRLEWIGAQKAFWLIYVIQQTTVQREFTAPQIRNTFNARFMEAKPFKRTSNIYRDLPKLKWEGQTVVGVHEGKFFLTQAAEAYFRNLPKPAAG